VQTADERIFPGGTAFLCDAGMCGPDESCLGRDYQAIIRRFLNGMPGYFPIASGSVRLCGAIVEVDEATGKAIRLWRVNETIGEG
jgi:2',3'-cyclic-nucleotide 2'-phosphodiesterase